MPNKQFYLSAPLTLEKKDATEGEESDVLRVSGYASTNDMDRDGDVIEASAWNKPGALKNYLNNPIILAYHDHRQPIGKMVEHTVDGRGLHIVAEISKAAGDIYKLVKDGILTTFSVGFMVKDAEWDSKADLFRIKKVELFETSVVSLPANASATFSVGKSFDTEDEYNNFKQQFDTTINEDNHMPEGIDNKTQPTPGLSATEVATIVAKAIADSDARKEAETVAKNEAASVVSGAVKEATDRLEADFSAKLANAGNSEKALQETIALMAGEIKESKESLEAARTNKMRYEGDTGAEITKSEADNAILLGLATNKNFGETSLGKKMLEKSAGEHVPTTTGGGNANLFWEEQFATGILNQLEDILKVAPLFSSIAMPSSTYRLPVNPRNAVDAAWIDQASALRAAGSTGTAADHQLEDIVMVAKKLAAKTYIGYEEEEDAIIPILPFIRENLVRRMAEAKDESLLLGTGSGLGTSALGISGLLDFATPVESVIAASGTVTVAILRGMRAAMGIHGLNQSELVYIVSTEVYYDLLEDTTFQSVDKVANMATLLSGEIGKIGSIPVVVSDRFPAKANDAEFAALVYRKNYILGELRGLMTETDKDIEQQKNIIVTTQRMAFEEIEAGVGVEFLKYDADGL